MLLNTKKIREHIFFHFLSESVSFVVNKNIKLPQSLLTAAVLIFLCCNFNYGQVTKENYDKAVDFFNCKIVEKSLDENVRSSTEADKSKAQQILERFQTETQNCQNSDYNVIQQFLELINIYPNTKKLSTEINLLKQKYSKDKTADELVTFITDESFRESINYPLLVAFASKPRKGSDFAEFREQLKISLKSIVEAEKKVKTPDNTNVQIPYSTPTEVSKDDKSWFDFVKLISLLNILVLIAGFVLFGLGYLHMSRRLRDTDNSYNIRNSDARLTKIKSKETSETLSRMSAEIKLLRNRIEQYENFRVFYEPSVQEKPSSSIIEKENSNYSSTNKTADQNYIKIIYFPIPNRDGIFKDDVKHFPFKEGTSVYKFSKTSNNEADFEIDSHEEAIRLAFNYPERIIESVCVSTNKPDQTKRQIVTIQPGKAVLRSGTWEITEMAVIRYESTASSPANSVNKESKRAEEHSTFTKRRIFKNHDADNSLVERVDNLFQTCANKPPSREVFYFPSPSQDGCFYDAARHSTFTAGKTIYKFSKLSGNRAEFEIDSRDDSVILALSYPDRNISPVCEIETSSGNKSRIINVQAGEAVLDGQKWKVTKKAIIRYEH